MKRLLFTTASILALTLSIAAVAQTSSTTGAGRGADTSDGKTGAVSGAMKMDCGSSSSLASNAPTSSGSNTGTSDSATSSPGSSGGASGYGNTATADCPPGGSSGSTSSSPSSTGSTTGTSGTSK